MGNNYNLCCTLFQADVFLIKSGWENHIILFNIFNWFKNNLFSKKDFFYTCLCFFSSWSYIIFSCFIFLVIINLYLFAHNRCNNIESRECVEEDFYSSSKDPIFSFLNYSDFLCFDNYHDFWNKILFHIHYPFYFISLTTLSYKNILNWKNHFKTAFGQKRRWVYVKKSWDMIVYVPILIKKSKKKTDDQKEDRKIKKDLSLGFIPGIYPFLKKIEF